MAGAVAACAVAAMATVAVAGNDGSGPGATALDRVVAGSAPARSSAVAPAYPARGDVRRAIRLANRDNGILSFAVIDSRGRLDGFEGHRRFVSASIVKAMLLAAELRRLGNEGLEMDPLTAEVLELMITISDNAAADEIYYRVGDDGLYDVAKKSGMKDFDVSGYWANAQISAVDMARFMRRLGTNMTGPDAGWARKLLASIAPEQRWGVPESIGPAWKVHFKGGWRATGLGEMVHQVALLRHPNGTVSSVAILSDGQPSQGDAIDDIRQIAAILYGEVPPDSPVPRT
jgi:hypothetical protein